MQRHFNLIKSENKDVEKRVFPRFPFSYLTFKELTPSDGQKNLTFQVANISKSGMQITLKNGGHSYIPGQVLEGGVQWKKAHIYIKGKVQWVKGSQLGIEFVDCPKLSKEMDDFLSIENIVAGMRPVHRGDFDLEVPSNLKYWLRADGPVEIFIWQHNDNELSKFQVILLNCFVEWQDGKGLKSGVVLRQKDVDSPLSPEDEFLFEFDESVDTEKIDFAQSVVGCLPEDYIPNEINRFLQVKLGKVLA